MSDLGWHADGIERAIAAGGIPLEVYRRPGFHAGKAVRRSDRQGVMSGPPFDLNSWNHYYEPENRRPDPSPPR